MVLVSLHVVLAGLGGRDHGHVMTGGRQAFREVSREGGDPVDCRPVQVRGDQDSQKGTNLSRVFCRLFG